jgi:hypothetical protein
MNTKTDTAKLRELLAKASKRPWKSKVNHAPYKCVFINEREHYSTLELKPEDADLIAAAINALPALLDALEDAEKRLDLAKRALEQIVHATSPEGYYDSPSSTDDGYHEAAFELGTAAISALNPTNEP